MQREFLLRVTIVDPSTEEVIWLRRRGEWVSPRNTHPGTLSFELGVRVETGPDGRTRFGGPFLQGAPRNRFLCLYVYPISEPSANPDPNRALRARLPLGEITVALIEEVLSSPGAILEARIAGAVRTGSVGTRVSLGEGWRVVREGDVPT